MSAANGGGGAHLSVGEPRSAATRRRLRLVNVSVGVVLGAEGVLMLVLSSSLLIVLICMFGGIRAIAALLGLFAANTAMILFGLLMERRQKVGEADCSAYWFGPAGAVPWVPIFWYVAGAPRVPGFVWAITMTQLILLAAFALNMALQYLRAGPWRSYLTGERGCLTPRLIAKSLLAWLIYANVLRT
jgi:hypothetical protein